MDCHSSKLFDISEGKVHFGHRSFHFSKGDKQLVTFLRGPKRCNSLHAQVTVTVWKLSPEGPKKCSDGSIRIAVRSCSSWPLNSLFFAMRSDDFAWIVTYDRSIYATQFDFSSVSFPNCGISDRPWNLYRDGPTYFYTRQLSAPGFERWHTELSQDGRCLANVDVRGAEVQLQVLSLSASSFREVITEKVYQLPRHPHRHIPVCLSSHFDTLVVGSYAFITSLRNSPPIEFDIDLEETESYTGGNEPDWECIISSCESLVAYCSPGRKDLGQLAIFRIDRSTLKSSRLEIPSAINALFKDLDIQVRSFWFHRSLPIATVTYNLAEGYKRLDYGSLPIMDLLTSTVHFTEPLTLPRSPFQRFWDTEWNPATDDNDKTELQRRRDLRMSAVSPGSLGPEIMVNSSAPIQTVACSSTSHA